jgi:hypothetical protein
MMILEIRELKYAGFCLLAFFMALVCAAQGAYPLEADLSVFEEARIAGNATSEVSSGEAFDYVITVSNNDLADSAPDVLVTDKLPYEVGYMNITVDPILGTSTVNKSGDLTYVRFDEIPANTTGKITIRVTAPTEAPTTLYNMVNIRYGNDPNQSNNRMTINTYVPLAGYDQMGSEGDDRISTTPSTDIKSDCGC